MVINSLRLLLAKAIWYTNNYCLSYKNGRCGSYWRKGWFRKVWVGRKI